MLNSIWMTKRTQTKFLNHPEEEHLVVRLRWSYLRKQKVDGVMFKDFLLLLPTLKTGLIEIYNMIFHTLLSINSLIIQIRLRFV